MLKHVISISRNRNFEIYRRKVGLAGYHFSRRAIRRLIRKFKRLNSGKVTLGLYGKISSINVAQRFDYSVYDRTIKIGCQEFTFEDILKIKFYLDIT